MTRWARSKNAHRHEKVPSNSTPWSNLKPKFGLSKNVSTNSVFLKRTNLHEGLECELQSRASQNVNMKTNFKKKEHTENIQKFFNEAEELPSKVSRESLADNTQEIVTSRKLKKKNKGGNKKLTDSFDSKSEATQNDSLVKQTTGNNWYMTDRENSIDAQNITLNVEKKKRNRNSFISEKSIKEAALTLREKTESSNKKCEENCPSRENVQKYTSSKKIQNKKTISQSKLSDTSGIFGNDCQQAKTLTKEKRKNNKLRVCKELAKDKSIDVNESEGKTIDKNLKKNRWRLKLLKQRKDKGMILLSDKIERKLYNLKKSLKKSGKSVDEIKTILRKERRHHELVFRRQQMKTCFRCRKRGHTVAECRNVLRDNQQSMGICFRCGSTEHMLKNCSQPVTDDKSLPFAKCFVCDGLGHLSGQCPKNSFGVFPKGGACNLCNSVTHMRKDCPTLQKRKEEPDRPTLAYRVTNIGSVDADVVDYVESPRHKKNKVVKF